MKQYRWKVNKVVQETADSVTIVFDTQEDGFTYLPGQFLNLKCDLGGERLSRSYSFSSTPSEKRPAITIKRIAGGKVSNYIFENAGNIPEWDIEAPFGNFILHPLVVQDTESVFLAGGSGITPLFSMINNLKNTDSPPLLLYSNKSAKDTIFYEVLEKLHMAEELRVFYSFSADSAAPSQLNHIAGRFSPLIIRSILLRHVQSLWTAHYYICGPTALIQLYKEVLLSLQVPDEHIHSEYFDPSVVNTGKPLTGDNSKEVVVNYYENLFLNDEPVTAECTTLIEVLAGQTLLDALKENDIKAASTCLKGTCGSCWARKEAGEIQMLNNYALTLEQVAAGNILLCQSYPLNQEVTITIPAS